MVKKLIICKAASHPSFFDCEHLRYGECLYKGTCINQKKEETQ